MRFSEFLTGRCGWGPKRWGHVSTLLIRVFYVKIMDRWIVEEYKSDMGEVLVGKVEDV